jgi:hypothetical protein
MRLAIVHWRCASSHSPHLVVWVTGQLDHLEDWDLGLLGYTPGAWTQVVVELGGASGHCLDEAML